MSVQRSLHEVLIAKLNTRCQLDDADMAAIRTVPMIVRQIASQNYMVREGARPTRCGFLVSGFAMRHKLTADGGRQIVGILVPGDFTDLQQMFLREADHNVQSLTRVEIADIATADLRRLAMGHPGVARALWVDALVEGSVTRETVLSIGRRDAAARIAHMLCEFEARLGAAGLANMGYELPMSQEQIGDATGLTSVHVNRTLRDLGREGLIARDKRSIRIVDWQGLQHRADFNPRYLHLEQACITD